jgi:hypothetical protein
MKYRESQMSEPNNKSVRINKNEKEKIMIKGNFNSAKKQTMDFSIAKIEIDNDN